MNQSPNIEQELIQFLQTGQRLVQESYDARTTMLHTANAQGADTIIPTGLVRIREFIHSDMITDSFLSDVLAHIGTLRALLGRVKNLYRDHDHPTYKRLEEFDKRCDNMSVWLGEWLTIRAEISTDPRPPRAGAKRKTGKSNTKGIGKRGRGGALESLRSLYDDIEAKMRSVYEELNKSGVNGAGLALVQQARRRWPGDVKYFEQNIRKQIANILGKAQETLDAEGTGIWLQINEIIQLLVPPQAGDEEMDEGTWPEFGDDRHLAHMSGMLPVGRMPQKADITTLLRQMRQLCV
jgi:hypothetical protein